MTNRPKQYFKNDNYIRIQGEDQTILIFNKLMMNKC